MAPRLGMNARQRFKMIQNLPPSEARAYAEREADLLARIPRKFVLVKGTEITEPFDTQAAAVRRGYELFGELPFHVKRVAKPGPPLIIVCPARPRR